MRVVVRLGQSSLLSRGVLPLHPFECGRSEEETFARLVASALDTPFYSRPGHRELLASAQCWEDLPTTSLREYWQSPAAFRNSKIRAPRRQLLLPFPSLGCTLVGGADSLSAPRRHRAPDWWKLNGSATRLLAAPPPVLRRVAAAILAGEMTLPQLDEAVLVLTSLADGTLYPGERNLLWQAFGVPIFERWLGFDGELIAWECDAHSGLHLNSPQVLLEMDRDGFRLTSWLARHTPVLRLECDWHVRIATEPFRCGHPSPLLLDLSSVEEHEDASRQLAAQP